MLHVGFCRSPPIVSYAGSKVSVEDQLMGDFPPVAEPKVYHDLLSKLVGFGYKFKVELSNLPNDPKQIRHYIIRVSDHSHQDGLYHLPMTPNCDMIIPGFPVAFGSTTGLKMSTDNIAKEINLQSDKHKGKSPLVPYSRNMVKDNLKRNLNTQYDNCIVGESSNAGKVSKLKYVNGSSSSYSTHHDSTHCPE
ncbi:hypothetical protein RIF29_29163 [Crotalaria pallida]|uniref:Uncharacterized protein n=1 Tax=Crotalaria pallida TaxID=3830 RepID=A0AAN9HW06_CROPI